MLWDQELGSIMVKSVPMRDHSVVIKPRRRAGPGIVIMLVLMLAVAGTLIGFGFLSPTRLAFAQERTLGLLHGGVFDREERTFIDACVELQGVQGNQAVTRTIRTITFNDGTSLSVTFSTSPAPTTAVCGGGGGGGGGGDGNNGGGDGGGGSNSGGG
jgi:uncharacterized membrane protein YgcG